MVRRGSEALKLRAPESSLAGGAGERLRKAVRERGGGDRER